jgi:hypothetical protein
MPEPVFFGLKSDPLEKAFGRDLIGFGPGNNVGG